MTLKDFLNSKIRTYEERRMGYARGYDKRGPETAALVSYDYN